MSEVRRFVRPEFFNRIDRVVPFAPLSPESVLAITRRELELIRARDGIRHRGVYLEVDDSVCAHLARRGYDVRYGARPLKRAIEAELLAPVADRLNRYASDFPLDAAVWLENDCLKIKVRPRDVSRGSGPVDRAALSSGRTLPSELDDGFPSESGSGPDADGTVEDDKLPRAKMGAGSRTLVPETVKHCVALRREMQTLERGGAYLARKNEAARLQRVARMHARRQWKSETHLRQLARLERLTEASKAFVRLYERVCWLEDKVVLKFTLGSVGALMPSEQGEDSAGLEQGRDSAGLSLGDDSGVLRKEVEQVASAWEEQLLALLDLEQDMPGQVVLGIYGTSTTVLLRVCRGYFNCLQELGYEVRLWEVTKAAESDRSEDGLERNTGEKAKRSRKGGTKLKKRGDSEPRRTRKKEKGNRLPVEKGDERDPGLEVF